jgi:excisionase family DNA binding protein
MEKLMTIKQFAERFCVGRSTVYREHDAGRLPFRKIGRASRISESDAVAWFNNLPVNDNHPQTFL